MAKLQSWEKDVRDWKPQAEYRLERDLELEWINRLKSAVHAKYRETDASFVRLIEDMLEVERAPENLATATLGNFLEALLKVIREDREPTESLYEFVREATERGSIQSPPAMAEFSGSRDYRSQGLSAQAAALESEDGPQGDGLESGELVKPLGTELAAEPAVLDAPEGDVGIAADEVIESDKPAAHLGGDPTQLVPIPREDAPAEPIDGEIREL